MAPLLRYVNPARSKICGVLSFNEQNLQAAFQISQQMKNSQNIKTAVDRASKIVFALKSSHNDHAQEMVLASIPETIETVLTISTS